MKEQWSQRAGDPAWKFVRPPTWPRPPAGWAPEAGWQPDPGWDTPDGWRWMRRRKARYVLTAVVATGVAIVFAISLLVSSTGHSVDPTDPINFNTYAITNDYPDARYLHLCGDDKCSALDRHSDWTRLEPGSETRASVYWGTSTPTAYRVAITPDSSGTGSCLTLDAKAKASSTVTELLSAATQCAK